MYQSINSACSVLRSAPNIAYQSIYSVAAHIQGAICRVAAWASNKAECMLWYAENMLWSAALVRDIPRYIPRGHLAGPAHGHMVGTPHVDRTARAAKAGLHSLAWESMKSNGDAVKLRYFQYSLRRKPDSTPLLGQEYRDRREGIP
jgi:hypothetical protein